MNAFANPWALRSTDQQVEWLQEGSELLRRGMERLLTTQQEGYRDWLQALAARPASPAQIGEHVDHGVNLGCALLVAQVSLMNDAIQLAERALADQQRQLLGQLDTQTASPLHDPMRKALCVSACTADSMSKAVRQVASFASHHLSTAAVSAVQQARDKITSTH
ncbi:hypothetical protein [Chitinimonas sp. BJYL2]|uniref:hypothetical protein n=1 Tax=Chitinimonas sp. BJYL2 TaxID=2976696 RepID=UPI0022B53E2E|nr:hypothetical protein [Chitinimonas sp. BJYL2]